MEHLTQSRFRAELDAKHDDKVVAKMWAQFWGLMKISAVGGVLVYTHAMVVFVLIAVVVALFTIYKLNRI